MLKSGPGDPNALKCGWRYSIACESMVNIFIAPNGISQIQIWEMPQNRFTESATESKCSTTARGLQRPIISSFAGKANNTVAPSRSEDSQSAHVMIDAARTSGALLKEGSRWSPIWTRVFVFQLFSIELATSRVWVSLATIMARASDLRCL